SQAASSAPRSGRGLWPRLPPARPTDWYRCHRYTRSIAACERGHRESDRDTPPRMPGPPDHSRRAPPLIGPPGIRDLLQPGPTASDAWTADTRAETPSDDWSDPDATSVERAASRLRTCGLSTAEVLPSDSAVPQVRSPEAAQR